MKEQYSSPLMDQISITQMDQFSIDKNTLLSNLLISIIMLLLLNFLYDVHYYS